MRGLSSHEKEMLEEALAPLPEVDDDPGLSVDEESRYDRLVTRGCLRTLAHEYQDSHGEVWEAEFYAITDLGRLALSVCSVDGQFPGISW